MISGIRLGSAGNPVARAGLLKFLIAFIPVFLLATWFFFDTLFLGKSIIHGDSIAHGLSVLDYHAKVLSGEESALWSDKIFGGHPVFAEAQFAFLSPLNVFVAATLSPVFGHNVFHWLCLLLTGSGMIALGRSLDFSWTATTFAACAVAFSGLWLDQQQNLTISGALVWVPWALWALERWLKNPANFLPLSIVVTLSLFAGYPQILHGTLIYMVFSLISLLTPSGRIHLGEWRGYLVYGLIAVCLCVGLSAVQLLPMYELVGYSHRSDDVELMNIPAENLLRGMMYAADFERVRPPYFWLLASLLVCVLSSAILIVRPSARILGHCFATFILFNLGFGKDSPLFTWFYDSNLLPGLHYFRLSWPYFSVAIVGLALIAGTVVDGLQRVDFGRTRVLVVMALLAIFWSYASYQLHTPQMPRTHYLLLMVSLVVGALLVFFSRRRYLAHLMLVMLVLEIALLKIDTVRFYDSRLLHQPSTVSYLRDHLDTDNYRAHHITEAGMYAFQPPLSPDLAENMQVMMAAITPSTNLLWDILAFGGAHALPQSRRMLIEDEVIDEIENKSGVTQGFRLIDMLAIRYITSINLPAGESMKMVYRDDKHNVSLVENTAARARFQTYKAWQFVDGPEQALEVIQTLDRPMLLVEGLESGDATAAPATITDISSGADAEPAIQFQVQEATSTSYSFRIDASEPGWFFIADANYPGWEATLNDRSVPVYSAQVLGKAVQVPVGQHELVLQFKPTAFRLGLVISLCTVVGGVLWWLLNRRRDPKRERTVRC